jgi:hypothetical protein
MCEDNRHGLWSHRADLGGVGIARTLHGPCNMVSALGPQDLWAAGVEPNWALRLPGQCTQDSADNPACALRLRHSERGVSRRSDESPAIEAANHRSTTRGTTHQERCRRVPRRVLGEPPAKAGQRLERSWQLRLCGSMSLRATATSQPKGNNQPKGKNQSAWAV